MSSSFSNYLLKDLKILFVTNDFLIFAKGYKLFKYNIATKQLSYFAKLNKDIKNLFSSFFLTRRLLRAEITHLYHFNNDNWFCIAKKGIFRLNKKTKIFEKVCHIERGSRPLNLCQNYKGNIYFGEYFANMNKEKVHIFGSKGEGNTWDIVYTFPKGKINHIHGLFYDKYTQRIWFCTGDRNNECIIGYTEDDFKSIVEVLRGGQEYRTCNLFFYPEYIVFATDSQYIQNAIKKFYRKTLEIIPLQDIQGSAIKGGQVGDMSFLSTTVEPSEINKDKYSHVWVSKGDIQWKEVYKAKKDLLPATLFQFGTFEFPEYDIKGDLQTLYFSGRSLKGFHGKTLSVDLDL